VIRTSLDSVRSSANPFLVRNPFSYEPLNGVTGIKGPVSDSYFVGLFNYFSLRVVLLAIAQGYVAEEEVCCDALRRLAPARCCSVRGRGHHRVN